MSSAIPPRASLDDDLELHTLMVGHFHLSEDSLRTIYDCMQTNDLSFGEAALQTGLVTADEISEALVRARTKVREPESGIIETAIRRVASDRQVVLRQGAPVEPGVQLILAHDPDNPRSERIRALRTELLLLSENNRGAVVIAIVSPCAGEGRSQLTAELAISFAQLGRRTLLVDADLRKSKQHLLFGSDNEHGLSEAIARNERPYFHPVKGFSHMHLLTAGPVARNPLELLSDGRFEKRLNEWRNSYEFVVIDTPPVTQCADGLAVATLAGRVLMLSRAQHTSFKTTRETLRRLATTQSLILGAVLNHF